MALSNDIPMNKIMRMFEVLHTYSQASAKTEICTKRAGLKTLAKIKPAYATIIKINVTGICCEAVKRTQLSHDKRVDLRTLF